MAKSRKQHTDSLSQQILLALDPPILHEKTAVARCSGIWSCMRYQYFDHMEEGKTEKSGHLRMTLTTGTIMHEGIQDRLIKGNLLDKVSLERSIEIAHPQKPEFILLSGHIDGITVPLEFTDEGVTPGENGEQLLLEIKTIRDRPSVVVTEGMKIRRLTLGESTEIHGRVEKSLDDLGLSMLTRPKKSHLAQASLYAHACGLNQILFMYVCTNMDPSVYPILAARFPRRAIDLPYQLFIVDKNEELIQLSIERAILLDNYLELGEPPPKEYYHAMDGFPQCNGCTYARLCYPSS